MSLVLCIVMGSCGGVLIAHALMNGQPIFAFAGVGLVAAAGSVKP